MFSLDGSVKYWLYNKPVDMRKSFNGLSGIVTNGMCASLRSGVTGINKYSEIGNVSAVKMESVIQ